MTIHLSNVAASQPESAGDCCITRTFRHTDFSRGSSPVIRVDHFDMTASAAPAPWPPEPRPGCYVATLLLEDTRGSLLSSGADGDDQDVQAGDLHWARADAGATRVRQPANGARPSGWRLNGLRIVVGPLDAADAGSPAPALIRGWEMPVIQTDAGRIRVVAGSHGGWQSPLVTAASMLVLDGWLRPGATQLVPLPPGWNAWLYVVSGELGVRARHRRTGAPALPKQMGGDPDFAVLDTGCALTASASTCASASAGNEEGVLVLMAGRAPVHFVLVGGPAGGPVSARGVSAGTTAAPVTAKAKATATATAGAAAEVTTASAAAAAAPAPAPAPATATATAKAKAKAKAKATTTAAVAGPAAPTTTARTMPTTPRRRAGSESVPT
ncbi:pirin family protein [Achromobacter sp. B7]|uniref:pirin family protein n=1 Tax=Achromobacter sp. B7 TaxID=2282475 RepID=UPI001968E357|nr:pirin family protein [Achromobacter sp. B7]